MTNRRLFILVALIIVLIPILACNSGKEIADSKIDPLLVNLIQAEKRGEAESFAGQNHLNLKNNQVATTITPALGQAETAVKALIEAGGELASDYKNQPVFDAWVPITKLEVLANEKSIISIGVPEPGELSY